MSILLRPFSLIFSGAVKLRNCLYDLNVLRQHSFSTPIVSVGNITVGGTGKTPIICELLAWANSKGIKAGVVSRGYKGSYQGVEKVALAGSPHFFGDEPLMIAKMFPSVPVYVGRNRVDAVRELIKCEQPQIIFADDAFQHRKLKRQLDIVVVDATEKLNQYRLLPEGRAREPICNLKRADFVILNKVNLITPEVKETLIDRIENECGIEKPKIVECEYYLKEIRSIENGEIAPVNFNEKIMLLTALGKPKSVHTLLSATFQILEHYVFPDHYYFTKNDLEKIASEMNSQNVKKIVVTEKDAVKLLAFKEFAHLIWVTQLTPKLSIQKKILYEKIGSILN